jgi:hypothetical protein
MIDSNEFDALVTIRSVCVPGLHLARVFHTLYQSQVYPIEITDVKNWGSFRFLAIEYIVFLIQKYINYVKVHDRCGSMPTTFSRNWTFEAQNASMVSKSM